MKKCTNCAKDLPDAALHCVFCGSKQPPAPAPAAGAQAKTVMGWQATDLLKDMQAKGAQPAPGVQMPPPAAPPPHAPPAVHPPSVQATIPAGGYMPPPQAPAPGPAHNPAASAATMFVQGPVMAPAPGPAAPPPPAGHNPAAQAATMFVQGPAPAAPPMGPPQGGYGGPPPPMGGPMGGPPQGGYGGPPPPQGGYGGPPPPQGGYGGPPPPQGGYGGPPQGGYGGPPQGGMGGYNPVPVGQGPMPGAGMQPQPMNPPYLASRTAARVGAPVEPYKDGIKLVLIVFGALLLAVFAAPLATDPLVFRWDALSSDKLDALGKFDQIYFAAAGLLALVFGAVPLATVPRGALAAVLGLVPLVLGLVNHLRGPKIEWQVLVTLVGAVTLVPGLMLRNEYRSQLLPRLLTTIGAACVLVVYLVPKGGGDPPIVAMFEAIGNAPGKLKVLAILKVVPAILALVSLLCWLPPPSTAGAKPVAWVWIALGVIISYVSLLVAGHLGDAVSKAPNSVLVEPWAGAAWSAFIGYGLATIFGKGLEHS